MKPTFYKQNHSVFRLLLLLTIPFLSSCEKVIDIDLKDAEPRTVIEASVTDQAGPYTVLLSRSVRFSDPNVFPAISNAQVSISDNAGNSEMLTETEPGIYQTKTLQGEPGRNYFLKVEAEGEVYEAVSQMPQPVIIQSILVEPFLFNEKEKAVTITFQDPPGVSNYYRMLYTINGKTSDEIYLSSDEFQEGNLMEETLFDNDMLLKPGDSVEVVLQSIEKPVWKYLQEQTRLGNSQATSPANPTSNISNKALGYFSAHASSKASIVVP